MMLGFTSSLPLTGPIICPSEDFGDLDIDPLFIAFSVSSILSDRFGYQATLNRREHRRFLSVLISLLVVLVQVVPFVDHLSTSKVQCDLPVLARRMPQLSQLLLLFPQLLSLFG